MDTFQHGRGLAVLAAALFVLLASASSVSARAPRPQELSADLDGVPIELSEVSDWYCHDFDYPQIHCFSDPHRLELSSLSTQRSALTLSSSSGVSLASLTAVTYVTVYEFPSYQGAFFQMSADYTALSLIGWNDRISSFKGRNAESGIFYVDWFNGGSQWTFCCNQEVPSLNAYDNTFSSVRRT